MDGLKEKKSETRAKFKKKVLKVIQTWGSVMAKEQKEKNGKTPGSGETRRSPNLMRKEVKRGKMYFQEEVEEISFRNDDFET